MSDSIQMSRISQLLESVGNTTFSYEVKKNKSSTSGNSSRDVSYTVCRLVLLHGWSLHVLKPVYNWKARWSVISAEAASSVKSVCELGDFFPGVYRNLDVPVWMIAKRWRNQSVLNCLEDGISDTGNCNRDSQRSAAFLLLRDCATKQTVKVLNFSLEFSTMNRRISKYVLIPFLNAVRTSRLLTAPQPTRHTYCRKRRRAACSRQFAANAQWPPGHVPLNLWRW